MIKLTSKQENELYVSTKVKQYNEEGNEINTFQTPSQREEKRKYFEHIYKVGVRIAKTQQKDKISERVKAMKEPLFITFTWDNDKMDIKGVKRSLQAYFKSNNIKYVLVSDMGKEKKEHFHGFIDLSYNSELLKNIPVKAKGMCKTLIHYYNLGYYNIIEKLSGDINKAINYCVKYCIKEINYKHKLFCSRELSKIQPNYNLSASEPIGLLDLINDSELPF